MTAEIDVSKLNVFAAIGPQSSQQPVSKVLAYADIGKQTSQLSVSKVTVYAVVNTTPLVRRKTGVSTRLGRFARPAL